MNYFDMSNRTRAKLKPKSDCLERCEWILAVQTNISSILDAQYMYLTLCINTALVFIKRSSNNNKFSSRAIICGGKN